MLSKHSTEGRHQITLAALDELVPLDHLVRKIDQVMDFDLFMMPFNIHILLIMDDPRGLSSVRLPSFKMPEMPGDLSVYTE